MGGGALADLVVILLAAMPQTLFRIPGPDDFPGVIVVSRLSAPPPIQFGLCVSPKGLFSFLSGPLPLRRLLRPNP